MGDAELRLDRRRADATRPYGYGFEQYVWAMISGVSTFILGAGASVYHGVSLVLQPQPLEALPTALGLLAAAGMLESYTLSVAWSELKREAVKMNMSPWEYLSRKAATTATTTTHHPHHLSPWEHCQHPHHLSPWECLGRKHRQKKPPLPFTPTALAPSAISVLHSLPRRTLPFPRFPLPPTPSH